jgi:hypothetical protein
MGVLPVDVPSDPAAFCEFAVKYVNENVWGNLSTTVFVDPSTLSGRKDVIEKMVDALEVGAVGVNIWGGLCVLFPHLHWGAYPGWLQSSRFFFAWNLFFFKSKICVDISFLSFFHRQQTRRHSIRHWERGWELSLL